MTSRLLFARWRQRRTIRTSLLSRCVPVARIYFLLSARARTKMGALETKLPPTSSQARLRELDRALAGSVISES